jgi:hypothetical protein
VDYSEDIAGFRIEFQLKKRSAASSALLHKNIPVFVFHLNGKICYPLRMTGPNATDPELGRELFRCRPKSLWSFFALRYQGALPAFKWLNFLNPIIAVTSPIAESFVLAFMPTILAIFVLQVIFGLKPPHEPLWVRPFCFAVLAISVPVALWWHWVAPRKDFVIVHEHGFRWRASLSRRDWFRSRGIVANSELEAFSCRSDCFASEPVEVGKTTSEKLSRIWLELNLSRHDVGFHLKDNRDIVVEKFFARFDQDDLRRFLDHLATVAQPHRIAV